MTMHDGENVGLKYFAYHIKKCQRAYNHIQLYDNALEAKKIKHLIV